MLSVATIAALCAAGVMLLSTGVYRLRARGTTSRRVAELLGEGPTGYIAPRVHVPSPLALGAQHALARIEARGDPFRVPAVALACLAALIGVASISPMWLVIAALAAVIAYLMGAGQRRRARVEAQALDTLELLASGLRAGYSVSQAIDLVARHSPQPTAGEFALTSREISLGVPLYEAVARLARRNANKDYELVAIIIRVQHEVGGNLARILDSVGSTLRERFELRRQINAVTAQQRLSSMVLTFLPFGLLLFLFVMDRSFVEPLFETFLGRVILALSGAMVFIGWSIMRTIGRIEI
jgi:tight adherence protein B